MALILIGKRLSSTILVDYTASTTLLLSTTASIAIVPEENWKSSSIKVCRKMASSIQSEGFCCNGGEDYMLDFVCCP